MGEAAAATAGAPAARAAAARAAAACAYASASRARGSTIVSTTFLSAGVRASTTASASPYGGSSASWPGASTMRAPSHSASGKFVASAWKSAWPAGVTPAPSGARRSAARPARLDARCTRLAAARAAAPGGGAGGAAAAAPAAAPVFLPDAAAGPLPVEPAEAEAIVGDVSLNWKGGLAGVNDDVTRFFGRDVRAAMGVLKAAFSRFVEVHGRLAGIVGRAFPAAPWARDLVPLQSVFFEMRRFGRSE